MYNKLPKIEWLETTATSLCLRTLSKAWRGSFSPGGVAWGHLVLIMQLCCSGCLHSQAWGLGTTSERWGPVRVSPYGVLSWVVKSSFMAAQGFQDTITEAVSCFKSSFGTGLATLAQYCISGSGHRLSQNRGGELDPPLDGKRVNRLAAIFTVPYLEKTEYEVNRFLFLKI